MYRIGVDARLTHYRQGGISQYVYALIRLLPSVDQLNEYLIVHSRKDRRDLTCSANQRRIVAWTPPHHLLERLTLAAEMRPRGVDLLHSPDFIPPMKLGRWKSVITIHDLTFLRYPEFLTPESRRYYNGQIEWAVAHADHIMADSEATRQDIVELLQVDGQKVTTVWLGIDEHFSRRSNQETAQVLAKHDLPSGYILFVGTLEPRKNLGGLLNAHKHLVAEYSDTPPLLIVGRRGWLMEDIMLLADGLGLEGRVHWREDIPYQDLPFIYSGANVLCLPSFYEGFGFPPLEAMACGTPVVAANRASLPEVVGDAGLLFNPDKPEDIAAALHRVLADSALSNRLREAGLERVRQFQWIDTVKSVLKVYQQVLSSL